MSHCMWALRALHGSVYFSSPGTMQKWRYQARAWNKQLNCQHQEKAEHVAEIFIIWQKKNPKQIKRKNCLKPLPKQILLNSKRVCWTQSLPVLCITHPQHHHPGGGRSALLACLVIPLSSTGSHCSRGLLDRLIVCTVQDQPWETVWRPTIGR